MSGLPAWRLAPVDAVHAFAAASVRLWREIDGAASMSWTARMAEAAREWVTYRGAAA